MVGSATALRGGRSVPLDRDHVVTVHLEDLEAIHLLDPKTTKKTTPLRPLPAREHRGERLLGGNVRESVGISGPPS